MQSNGKPNISLVCFKYLSQTFSQHLPDDFIEIMTELLTTRQTKQKELFSHDTSNFMVNFTGMLF
jgi:hypothetical protein